MNLQECLDVYKNIQQKIIEYLDDTSNVEENYQNLIEFLESKKIKEDNYKLQELLFLILKISNYHQRSDDFFFKIEKILNNLKEEMKTVMTNSELFHAFKNNRRLLLFLIEENIIIPDKVIIETKIEDTQYISYFLPNFKYFVQRKSFQIQHLMGDLYSLDSDIFEQKRKLGENDKYICELIRKDSIEDFIIFVKKNDFVISSKVENSIFETNLYLIKNQPTLIEYSAFFGSAQIFKYLYLNGCSLTPSLWLYAIHGCNEEIIKILEENDIKPNDESYIECYNESIKCHHTDITEYLLKNFLEYKTDDDLVQVSKSIKYSNFLYFPNDFKSILIFHKLCRYNHILFVNYLFKEENIDSNAIYTVLILYLIQKKFKFLFIHDEVNEFDFK